MSVTLDDGNEKYLEFKQPVNLDDFGKLLGAYDTLINILEGRSPTYEDFTQWLKDQGYVK